MSTACLCSQLLCPAHPTAIQIVCRNTVNTRCCDDAGGARAGGCRRGLGAGLACGCSQPQPGRGPDSGKTPCARQRQVLMPAVREPRMSLQPGVACMGFESGPSWSSTSPCLASRSRSVTLAADHTAAATLPGTTAGRPGAARRHHRRTDRCGAVRCATPAVDGRPA